MTIRKSLAIAVVWAVSLFGVALWAQNGGGANQRQAPVVPSGAGGPYITGENLAFQPMSSQPDADGRIAGRFMVRVNGAWHEVTSSAVIIR